jgi:phasin family protein
MAKGTMNFPEQNAERAMQVANYGTDWMRDMTEQSLKQSKTAFEGFLEMAGKTVENIDQQASEIHKRSISLVAETLSNTFDFAHKIIQAKEPQELLQLQSDFISRQAQAVAEQSKQLGQHIVQGAKDAGRTSHGIGEASRRGSEAA